MGRLGSFHGVVLSLGRELSEEGELGVYPIQLLFCSSYSCCRLQVLENKFGKGVFPHHLTTSSHLPLLSPFCSVLRFKMTSLPFPAAERRESSKFGWSR